MTANARTVSRTALSQPSNDGGWVLGACWLWCRRVAIPVIWIGPVVSGGAHAPLMACAWCLDELGQMVWQYLTVKDANLDPRLPG